MTRRLVVAVCGALAFAGGLAAHDVGAGIAHFEAGRYTEAEAALRGAAGLDAKAYLAASIAKQKRYEEAEAPASEVLAEVPAHPIAVAALGESLVGQKKFDAAVERMSAALGERQDVAYAYYWRGQAWNNKRQADRMVADFESFLRLAPKAPEAPLVQQLLAALR